jgi:hypothetical protein
MAPCSTQTTMIRHWHQQLPCQHLVVHTRESSSLQVSAPATLSTCALVASSAAKACGPCVARRSVELVVALVALCDQEGWACAAQVGFFAQDADAATALMLDVRCRLRIHSLVFVSSPPHSRSQKNLLTWESLAILSAEASLECARAVFVGHQVHAAALGSISTTTSMLAISGSSDAWKSTAVWPLPHQS